jgi:hypothetical protein
LTDSLEIPSWVFPVDPYEGESLSHFLGRFRRANYATASQLGQKTGLGAAIARWEKFYLNPFPTERQLEVLAAVVRVDAERLRLMLPAQGIGMKHEPIRLCAACYVEEPYHHLKWQFKETSGCDRHQLRLLSECPNCGARFAIPALWVDGACQHCSTSFSEMAGRQKAF